VGGEDADLTVHSAAGGTGMPGARPPRCCWCCSLDEGSSTVQDHHPVGLAELSRNVYLQVVAGYVGLPSGSVHQL
jgi:hypothetical protein